MSHDRGCWRCFRDRWEYDSCPTVNCVKRATPLSSDDKKKAQEEAVKKQFLDSTAYPKARSGPVSLDHPAVSLGHQIVADAFHEVYGDGPTKMYHDGQPTVANAAFEKFARALLKRLNIPVVEPA